MRRRRRHERHTDGTRTTAERDTDTHAPGRRASRERRREASTPWSGRTRQRHATGGATRPARWRLTAAATNRITARGIYCKQGRPPYVCMIERAIGEEEVAIWQNVKERKTREAPRSSYTHRGSDGRAFLTRRGERPSHGPTPVGCHLDRPNHGTAVVPTVPTNRQIVYCTVLYGDVRELSALETRHPTTTGRRGRRTCPLTTINIRQTREERSTPTVATHTDRHRNHHTAGGIPVWIDGLGTVPVLYHTGAGRWSRRGQYLNASGRPPDGSGGGLTAHTQAIGDSTTVTDTRDR